MDLTKILEYQKVDGELFSLENKLNNSISKKKCIELTNEAKKAQAKSALLEDKAGEALKEFEEAKKILAQNTKLSDALVKKDIEKMSAEELDSDLSFKEKIYSNLSVLDKKITKIAEGINAILSEYNDAVKLYNIAKNKYKESKDIYDKEVAEIQPKMKALESKLATLRKEIDPAVFEKYSSIRKDRIFPVFVPLLNNGTCGHCRMEISASDKAKLEREGVLSCEHCRCIIYK